MPANASKEGGHAVDVVLGIALHLLQRGLELELVGHGSSGRVVEESRDAPMPAAAPRTAQTTGLGRVRSVTTNGL